MKIKIQNARLSFPSLFHKAVYRGTETKYEATFLLDKDTHAEKIKEIKTAINGLIKSDLKGVKLGADKICFKDGDDAAYDGYENCYSFKAGSAKTRPMIIDRDKSPLTEDDERIYAGCYVNATIELWVQDNDYGKRINANLLGVQFSKDGEPFGDSVKASLDDFDMVDDDESEDPFATT